jgi:hypothetical protein
MQISENFTLKEFTSSETGMRLGIKEQFNPPANIIENLKLLAVEVAEPIRTQFGAFSPTVAYRCKRVNDNIKGAAKKSQHLDGQSFDETFFKDGKEISDQVFFWLVNNRKNLKFTKLIWEKGDIVMPDWLHIGITPGQPQGILVYDGKGYVDYFQSKHYIEHKKKGFVK